MLHEYMLQFQWKFESNQLLNRAWDLVDNFNLFTQNLRNKKKQQNSKNKKIRTECSFTNKCPSPTQSMFALRPENCFKVKCISNAQCKLRRTQNNSIVQMFNQNQNQKKKYERKNITKTNFNRFTRHLILFFLFFGYALHNGSKLLTNQIYLQIQIYVRFAIQQIRLKLKTNYGCN